MPIADKYRPQFTYEDYCRWEGRWELIEGMLYAMSPAPAPRHQIVNGNLQSIFTNSLRQYCNKCRAYIPIDWKISEDTVVQPNMLIACKDIDKQYLDFTPVLTLEILSPSTAFKDRHEKFELYEQQGVPYYVIVDPKSKKIEIYELKVGTYYLMATDPLMIEFTFDGCKAPVDFTDTWL